MVEVQEDTNSIMIQDGKNRNFLTFEILKSRSPNLKNDLTNWQKVFLIFIFSRSPPARRGGGSPRRGGSPGGRKRRGSVGSSTDSD